MTDKELREQAEKVWDNAFNDFLTQPGSMEKLRDDAVFTLAAALGDVYRRGVEAMRDAVEYALDADWAGMGNSIAAIADRLLEGAGE